MESVLYLATDSGLVIGYVNEDSWRIANRTLPDVRTTSVIAREGVILLGSEEGVFISEDEGQSWNKANNGLDILHVRWLAYHPDVSDLEFAGTEPAGIFVSSDGAKTWLKRPEVGELRDHHSWFLPYSPEAGCVRGFAHHGQRIFAAVEVGGMLRSDDRGESWKLAPGSDGVPRWGSPGKRMIHPDVHSVAVHPSSPDLVYAPTGGGFYRSSDGGRIWELRYIRCYCRAVWIDPLDSEHIILGPADSVDRNGRIEESLDGGDSWHALDSGIDVPWSRGMVERFATVDNMLLGVISDGRLLASTIGDWHWQRIFADVDKIRCVETMN
jgi:photosystem II stability/assembly factor-like uncharacterized protein